MDFLKIQYHLIILFGIFIVYVKAMQKNTSVTLGEHFDKFISHQIKTGRYGSASEAIRAGLRLLEMEEAKLETLRHALADGERSGRGDYSLDSVMNDLDAE